MSKSQELQQELSLLERKAIIREQGRLRQQRYRQKIKQSSGLMSTVREQGRVRSQRYRDRLKLQEITASEGKKVTVVPLPLGATVKVFPNAIYIIVEEHSPLEK